ncbi:arsenate reductase ArsC [Pseudomonas aeruginosa]
MTIGLRSQQASRSGERKRLTDRLRVLFVCIANDARSLIAEAILRHTDGEHFAAFSAGVRPAGVDPRTLSVLEHAGIPTQGLSSKPLETFAGESLRLFIDLCDKDTDELAQLPHSAQTLAWSGATRPSRKAWKDSAMSCRS